MMRATLARLLDSPAVPAVAGAISLALGLCFMFVWAPHPWGWQGIDAYHELARALARGDMFPTTDVPWGYAYYAAFFYRVFGERLWAPLLGQVIANAFVPLLLYRLVLPLAGRRTAALAAIIAGIFSFNTVYASTQASDAICTVLFMCALVSLSRGWRTSSTAAFALSGVLFGIVPQFRPNLVLLPAIIIAGYVLWRRLQRRALMHAVVFSLLVAAMQAPWIVRNYRLTGLVLPTSTHGGIQLWYGTLQVGATLDSRAHNPRSFFDSAAFDYASLHDATVIVQGDYSPCFGGAAELRLVYWTDRDGTRRRVPLLERAGYLVRFAIPPQPMPTAVYYFFEESDGAVTHTTPVEGAANPWVVFVSDDHLADLDRHDDILDIFDIGRMMRHLAWREPVRAADKLDFDRDGAITGKDLSAAVSAVLPDPREAASLPPRFESTDAVARLTFGDGSHLDMPRQFGGRQTDFAVDGTIAGALISSHRTFTSIAHPPRRLEPGQCTFIGAVGVNRVFYRLEPHMMGRYLALAYDNIGRDPMAFALASAYRAVRLFLIVGTDDPNTAQQFSSSRIVYAAGTVLSASYLAVFIAGVIIAWRQRSALLLFLVPIIYVPLTICFVLTNMRYTVTMQPLMFAFVAVAILAAVGVRPGGTTETASPRNE
jgi:hypothetical protein